MAHIAVMRTDKAMATCARAPVAAKVSQLVNSKRVEDLVGAVVLIHKLRDLPECRLCTNVVDNLIVESHAVIASSNNLILQLLSSESNELFHAASLSYLCSSSLLPKTQSFWRDRLSEIVRIAISCSNSDSQQLLRTTIKHLASLSDEYVYRDRVIAEVLNGLTKHPSKSPIEWLQLIGELLSLSPEEMLTLNESQSLCLQSLIVQCLHGLAQENIRDECLAVCLSILRPSSSLNWTWPTQEMATRSSKDHVNGNFPCILCSVVAGELHLCAEEVVYFYRQLYQSVSSPTDPPASHDQQLHRLKRGCAMLVTCSELVQSFMSLLVGTESTEGAWSTLPSEAMLVVRKHLHSCQSDTLELIQDLASALSEGNAHEGSPSQEVGALLCSGVNASVLMAVALGREDEELRKDLLTKLNEIFRLDQLLLCKDATGDAICELFQFLWSLVGEEETQEDKGVEWIQSDVLDALLPSTSFSIATIIRHCDLTAGVRGVVGEVGGGRGSSDACYFGMRYISTLLSLVERPLKILLQSEGEAAVAQVLQCPAADLQALYSMAIKLGKSSEDPDVRNASLSLVQQIESFTVLNVLLEG